VRHLQFVSAACLLLLPATLGAQGLGAVAARERAKRDKAAGKTSGPSYTNDSLKPAGDSAPAAGAAGSEQEAAQSAGTGGGTTGSTTVAPKEDELPFCPGGQEMLRAWSAAHSELAKECEGGPQVGTAGSFNMKLTISASGVVEAATVTPENPYTTCLARRMRGHPLVAPSNGKRCQTSYGAMWRL
jgi:hypothetical protein